MSGLPPAGTPADAGLLEELEGVTDDEAARRLVEAHPELRTRAVVEHLGNRVASLVLSDLDRAERIARVAVEIAAALDDGFASARALRATAHVLFSRGRWHEAAESYGLAADAFEGLSEPVEVGRTLSSSLQALIYLGRYDEALEKAQRARRIFEQAGDAVRLARLDSNLANVYFRQDRFAEALDLYTRARRQFEALGLAQDVAITLRNIATVQISLHRFDDSLATFTEAQAWCHRLGLPLLAVVAEYNIAYAHYLRGDYARAIRLYQEARERCAALGDDYHRSLCDLDQSEMYLDLNLVEQALALGRQACEGFEGLGMAYEMAKAQTFVAMALCREEKTYRGLELFARAGGTFERDGNSVWVAQVELFQALVLEREGRLYEAQQHCRRALRSFEQSGLEGRAALCEVLLARTQLQGNDPVASRESCRAAVARLARAPAPPVLYQALHSLGLAEERLGERGAAGDAYARADAVLRRLRTNLGRDELKIGFLRDKLSVFESLVSLALSEGGGDARAERVFGLVERAKARALADSLAFHAPSLPVRGNARSDLVAEVYRLREQLNSLEGHSSVGQSPGAARQGGELEALRRGARRTEDELMRTLGALADAPEFVSLQRGDALGVDALRAALPEDATLLEYHEARGTLVACVIGRDRAEVAALTPLSRLERLVGELSQQLSRCRLGPAYVQAHGPALLAGARARLHALHDELLAPLRPLLAGDRLIVVPHGVLDRVPFHALFDGRRYLCDDFTVSYAPSANAYALARARRRPAGGRALVLAAGDDGSGDGAPGAAALAAALPEASAFVGAEATADRLRALGPGSRFVHLLAPVRFRSDNPMFSSIPLSGSELNFYEVFGLDLPAELVAVSGGGEPRFTKLGNDLVGLSYSFLYAGAAATLLELWDPGPASATAVLGSFYRRAPNAADKAAALRAAMLERRETHPHPYDWAPYVLSGDTSPVSTVGSEPRASTT